MSPGTRIFRWLILCGMVGTAAPEGALGQTGGVPAQDRIAIKVLLDKYRDAILAADGAAVYKLFDAATLSWYDEALKDALTLKKADLVKRDYLAKLTVLRLRHDFTRLQLEKKTGQEVIVDAVKKGWIGGSFADMIVIQFVGKDKDGMVYATLRQSPRTPAFYFTTEDGRWKIAQAHSFNLANKGFEQLQAKSGLAPDEFLCKMLEDATRQKVDRAILESPREAEPKK